MNHANSNDRAVQRRPVRREPPKGIVECVGCERWFNLTGFDRHVALRKASGGDCNAALSGLYLYDDGVYRNAPRSPKRRS